MCRLSTWDLGALAVLAAAVFGAVFIGRQYFTRQWGAVTFHGANWSFTFPFLGGDPGHEIYQVINSVFLTRQAGLSQSAHRGRLSRTGRDGSAAVPLPVG